MSKIIVNAEKGKTGMLFEDFLKEQKTYEETTERTVKCVLVFQFVQLMKEYLELNQSFYSLDIICPKDSAS